MAAFSFIIGVVGNAISILMFGSPMKTFKRIIKKKTTENYKSLPYITTLLSTSLWTFYGLLKPGGLLVVTVNGTGAVLHIIYVSLYLIYAPKDLKVKSLKLAALVDIASLGAIVAVTLLALHGNMRLTMVGILCAGLTVAMYAAPLSVMKTVIKTKSVEYMPFFLSFFQFLNGGVWVFYAVLVKDIFIAVPNGVGFLLGSGQLILYMMYRNKPGLKSSTDVMERGGSAHAHLVKGVVELQGCDELESNSQNSCIGKEKYIPKQAARTPSLTTNALAIPEEKTDTLEISSNTNN